MSLFLRGRKWERRKKVTNCGGREETSLFGLFAAVALGVFLVDRMKTGLNIRQYRIRSKGVEMIRRKEEFKDDNKDRNTLDEITDNGGVSEMMSRRYYLSS